MSARRIAVLGTGANGAAIGADLTRAGEDVVFIEQWPAHVEAMRSNGIKVNMPGESITTKVQTLHLCEVATLTKKFDVVLMLMKAYDSGWAAQFIEPHLKSNGLLVGIQNGMSVDAIANSVGLNRTMGAVIEITSAMFEPGVVERHSNHSRSWFAVGSLDSSTAGREEEVASLLRHSGAVDIVSDIRATKWMKIVSNATTLVPTAILGIPMREAVLIPEMRRFMLKCGQEALAATLLEGNPILPIFGLTPDAVQSEELVVETLLDTLMSGFVLPNSTTTILQDWQKSRHSEVDEINGLVIRTRSKHGIASPANSKVIELAQRIESNELTPSMENLASLISVME
jgi:2-dehydropantoate 2-reductase